jgi:hypothetical protein
MAQRPKAKSKSKGQKSTDKKQSERFIETARKLAIEDTGGKFERTFSKLVPTARRRQGPT